MDPKYQSLFTPWKIGNCEIKNRIVLTSMGGTSIFGWMEPHHFDKEAANFLLDRAKNNVGLILPGIAPIRNVIGGNWLYKSKSSFRHLKPTDSSRLPHSSVRPRHVPKSATSFFTR